MLRRLRRGISATRAGPAFRSKRRSKQTPADRGERRQEGRERPHRPRRGNLTVGLHGVWLDPFQSPLGGAALELRDDGPHARLPGVLAAELAQMGAEDEIAPLFAGLLER